MYTSTTSSSKTIYYLRKIIPIPESGLLKFFSMAFLMFCILCNQSMLRILKDSIVISEVNAEITGFAKVVIFPVAAILVILYSKVADRVPYTKIYSVVVTSFILFFLTFAFFIYPNVDCLHISYDTVSRLSFNHPYLRWYLLLFGNWGYTTFYVLAELWPDVVYVIFFWQLANHITTVEQARSFYPALSFFGNSATAFMGMFMLYITSPNCLVYKVFNFCSSKILLVKVCVCILAIFGFVSIYLVHFISRTIIKESFLCVGVDTKKKATIGIIEGLKYVAKSRYLWIITTCSTAFYFSMNLAEALWKAEVSVAYPTVSQYAHLSSMCIFWTGVFTMILNVAGKSIMRLLNWKMIFSIPPVTMAVSGCLFFGVSLFVNYSSFSSTFVYLPVIFGAVHSVLAKGVKYSVWDISKEMLYIPLDPIMKTRGKAATDLIGSKFGKSFSSIVPVIILSFSKATGYLAIAPVIAVLFVIVCIIWLIAAHFLSLEYEKRVN